MPTEAVSHSGHDCPCRGDGELLAGDLEDQGSECVERRKLVQSGPGTETGPRVDQTGEDRVRIPKELARRRIGRRGRSLAGRSLFADRVADREAGHHGWTWEP